MRNIFFSPGEPEFSAASHEELANAFNPMAVEGDVYYSNAFTLGYFSAICVEADDVTLLLNGYTIEQGPGHALLQRFFAIIYLASAPFIPAVGPLDFVGPNEFVSAKNFGVFGPGKLGLSSHHGIHGNNNENITVCGVTFEDFEVAAVSLNNVDGACFAVLVCVKDVFGVL